MALINGMMQSWQDTFAVRRVFGEPVEKAGMVVIPVARVSGGGGSGGDRAPGHSVLLGSGTHSGSWNPFALEASRFKPCFAS